jgi:hypothetical protein
MRSTLPFFLLLALALPAAAADESPAGVPIRTGEWSVTSRTTVSNAPETQEREATACFENDTLTADQLTRRSSMCGNDEVEVQDGVMIWKVYCFGQMRGNSGLGRLEMKKDSFEGRLALYGIPRPDGERIVVTTTWKGRRLGECKSADEAAEPSQP